MAVQPPSEPAGARRACQSAFSPNISDSISNPPAPIARRLRKAEKKLNSKIPNFMSFSRRSSKSAGGDVQIKR
jgi:hypothetical protein